MQMKKIISQLKKLKDKISIDDLIWFTLISILSMYIFIRSKIHFFYTILFLLLCYLYFNSILYFITEFILFKKIKLKKALFYFSCSVIISILLLLFNNKYISLLVICFFAGLVYNIYLVYIIKRKNNNN